MVNAFRAGAIVAVLSGVVGWFMVLRRQSFAGHTLAVVSFPGAAGAALLGISATDGFFAFAVVAALVIAAVPAGAARAYSEESAVTGTVLALRPRRGLPLRSPCTAGSSAASTRCSSAPSSASPGPGRSPSAGRRRSGAGRPGRDRPAAALRIGRPDVAQARGVPVRLLSTGYLVLLALTAAEVSQITGTLLVFALLVAPPQRPSS